MRVDYGDDGAGGISRSLGQHQLTLSFLGSVSSEAAAPLNVPRRKFWDPREMTASSVVRVLGHQFLGFVQTFNPTVPKQASYPTQHK